jgi:hypothetical protein
MRVLLWIARASGTAIAAVLGFVLISGFAQAGGGAPTSREWLALSFFPIGVCLGHLFAWRWALWGGIGSVASLVVFFVIMTARGNNLYTVPAFYGFIVPSVLFISYGLWARRTAAT